MLLWDFVYHSYDHRPNWTPLSPIPLLNQQVKKSVGLFNPWSQEWSVWNFSLTIQRCISLCFITGGSLFGNTANKSTGLFGASQQTGTSLFGQSGIQGNNIRQVKWLFIYRVAFKVITIGKSNDCSFHIHQSHSSLSREHMNTKLTSSQHQRLHSSGG